MYNLKVAIFDENMAVGKSKYLVTLYLYEPSDPLILGGPLILACTAFFNFWKKNWNWDVRRKDSQLLKSLFICAKLSSYY